MGNPKLIPYETIVRAIRGEPEAVWSMEIESCLSNVANVICNLRKKIEPDSQNPTYIKTVLGMGYKFTSAKMKIN